MFGLKKLKRTVVNTFTPAPTVEEIHQAFDTAGERALLEAKNILAKVTSNEKQENVELLKKLGFNSAAMVTEQAGVNKSITENQFKVKVVEKYAQAYPQYKFIFIDQVVELCKKYGLLCAPVGMYKGNVPTKNLKEIEAFKVSNDDVYRTDSQGIRDRLQFDLRKGDFLSQTEFDRKSTEERNRIRGPQSDMQIMRMNHHYGASAHYTEGKFQKVPLFICAPKNEINIGPFDRVEDVFAGYEIKDPIVLHFVKDGFLVVSKWGPEANDPILLNEKMN